MKPIIAAHRLPTSPLGKLPRSLAPLRIRSRNHVAGKRPTVWGGHSCPPPLTSKRRTDHPRGWPRRAPIQNRMPHPWQFHGWAAANFPAHYPSQLNRSRLCSIIPLGWPTLTLKGAPFKLRLGGVFLDPNRPRRGLAHPYPNTKQDAPPVAVSRVGRCKLSRALSVPAESQPVV
jgi:hypothetical protein